MGPILTLPEAVASDHLMVTIVRLLVSDWLVGGLHGWA